MLAYLGLNELTSDVDAFFRTPPDPMSDPIYSAHLFTPPRQPIQALSRYLHPR